MRVILIVLDSVGIGALPDADKYGDEGSDTLGNIARAVGSLSLPVLASLGLGNLVPGSAAMNGRSAGLPGIPALSPSGACMRLALKSPGKDTITGHWEMAGVVLDKAFRTFPQGFPLRIIREFERRVGRRAIGNKAASGTEIIEELGEEHLRTGRPIVYTSADSVFQIACHEDVAPPDTLYSWCLAAREMLTGDDLVGRVIARPFSGRPGSFARTANRKDFSLKPFRPTLLDYAVKSGAAVIAVGKINDIFSGQGVSRSVHTSRNSEGVEAVLREMAAGGDLIFANLVDFDMLYGHRNDVAGYARALMEFDSALPKVLAAARDTDVLMITADHGCDPTTPGTDHSREYVPLLMYGKALRPGVILDDRDSLADIGATAADIMGIDYGGAGRSFAAEVLDR